MIWIYHYDVEKKYKLKNGHTTRKNSTFKLRHGIILVDVL